MHANDNNAAGLRLPFVRLHKTPRCAALFSRGGKKQTAGAVKPRRSEILQTPFIRGPRDAANVTRATCTEGSTYAHAYQSDGGKRPGRHEKYTSAFQR